MHCPGGFEIQRQVSFEETGEKKTQKMRRPCADGGQLGVTQPQAKQLLEPPEAETGKKGDFLRTAQGVQPFQHLDFGLPASRTERINLFQATQFMVICHSSPGHSYTVQCIQLHFLVVKWS